ncbi:hypothetical protein LINPERHAP1_LOCUS9938, partial [Linum perenne]
MIRCGDRDNKIRIVIEAPILHPLHISVPQHPSSTSRSLKHV